MIKAIYKAVVPLSIRLKLRMTVKKFYGLLFFKGNTYHCNVCNRSFKRFYAKGNGITQRANAECPNCGALERTRLLKFYLENETNFKDDNVKILHIAPQFGIRQWIKKYKTYPDYINGDLLAENADEVIDITDIPYDENTFDLEICSHVLGHVPKQSLALHELYRCLKPGGNLLLLTLLNQESDKTIFGSEDMTADERLKLFGEFDLVRLHGKDDLISACEQAGFKVDVIDYRTHFSQEERIRYALGNGERELIFKLTKDA